VSNFPPSTVAIWKSASFAAAPGLSVATLRGIDLRIDAGEQVALIGASGAGKTTLLMALACALRPLAGQVELFGLDPWALSSPRRQALRASLCLAPQVPPLPPRQRVVTAVLAGRLPTMGLLSSLAALWQPGARGGDLDAVHAALTGLDLGDKLWHRVDRLSGGERQRVGLARLLVSGAPLWLVDEPLSALDPARANQVITTLTAAARDQGRTLVCSLHQVPVARERFARVLALRAGELVYDGPGADLADDTLTRLYGPGWNTGGVNGDGAASADATPVDPAAPGSPLALPAVMCR
jgi:phosphonate transport system ATP-binding protein